VLNIYTPVYVQHAFGFTAQQAFAASLIGNVFFVLTCLAAGRLSDRLGRSTILTAGVLALLIAVLPLYLWLQAQPTAGVLIIVQSCFCIMVATFVGVAPAALADLFPTGVRATGISLVYNAAFVIFGGFAPAILTWFTQQANGSAMAPAGYVMCAALIGLATVPFFTRSCRNENLR
jgi:MHS family proline/betaine transporter-like MFS transporter